MPIPTEIAQLQTLLQRQATLEQRRAALAADVSALDQDFNTLYGSGALGVSEQNPHRYVNLKNAPTGKVRFIHVFWIARVNGVDQARAELIDIDQDV